MRTARGAVALVTGTALTLGLLSGCGSGGHEAGKRAVSPPSTRSSSAPPSVPPTPTPPLPEASKPEGKWDGKVRILGDGSTSSTGPQPHQPKPVKLKPGEKPPQFVVFSWDGALQGDDEQFSHFREVAKENNAQMTFFLTGTYLLPKSKAPEYRPPQHKRGEMEISYATDQHIRDTLRQLRGAWLEGNEIGTHFNGHFCGTKGGDDWSVDEWKSEIEQTYSFVENWKTNTGYKDLPPLPFDYRKELAGGRAPCLEGQKNLLKAAKSFGWRYDASSPGDFQLWPSKTDGIWNFPLQLVPYPGTERQVLSMDFNFLYNQSGDSTQGDPAKYEQWRKLTRDSYLNGFERVYNGSRAPLFIGNHFENWNGGIYMKAVEDVVKSVCTREDVRCVTFKQLADWLDVQDPQVLERMRRLDPAQSPDWKSLVE
ncbi:hypothetical protein EKH77_30790 [Streptomyces luteoverticillatus]|uniref:Lipoprotein n=1 Tax=Streptomyces luteoverticillatus TaxID=66425 RepID=A0A3Q9G3B9_STRLT|nr:hypothetical protein [Streptomyces luteoverticillatus]AZQ74976.1 hypothetical protein EKH77_30790 [Streptomyces luteoverticillatus]